MFSKYDSQRDNLRMTFPPVLFYSGYFWQQKWAISKRYDILVPNSRLLRKKAHYYFCTILSPPHYTHLGSVVQHVPVLALKNEFGIAIGQCGSWEGKLLSMVLYCNSAWHVQFKHYILEFSCQNIMEGLKDMLCL